MTAGEAIYCLDFVEVTGFCLVPTSGGLQVRFGDSGAVLFRQTGAAQVIPESVALDRVVAVRPDQP